MDEGIGFAGPADSVGGMGDVANRAAAGAMALVGRAAVVFGVGLVANVIFARTLGPSEFGIAGLGNTIIVIGVTLGGGGLGAALIARPEPPRLEELQAVLGLQLVGTLLLAVIFAVAGWLSTGPVAVLAVMVAALPIMAFRVPPGILLERELTYRLIARVELIEALAYYAWALAGLALGFGVWALATGAVFRAALGSAIFVWTSPGPFVVPSLALGGVRPILAFGARYQASSFLLGIRDQGLNLGIVVIGGLHTLGIWMLAYRILQIPYQLFVTLWRVSFPAMGRVVGSGVDPAPLLRRGISVVAVGTGALLVPIAAGADILVPEVLGDRWTEAVPVILSSSVGLVLSAPVAVATIGFLLAVGDSKTVLRDTLLQTLVWFAVAFSLIPLIGPAAIGLGWLLASVTEIVVLTRGARSHAQIGIVRALAVPAGVAIASGAAGWGLAQALPVNLAAGIGTAFLAEGLFFAAVALLAPDAMRSTWGLLTRSLRSFRRAESAR